MTIHAGPRKSIRIAEIGLLILAFAGWGIEADAQAGFDGVEMTTTWEYWNGASPGNGGSLVAVTDLEAVVADDIIDPDVPDFHSSTGTDYELWDVDFWQDEILLTYTSIYVQDASHQYMYLSPVGFHFEDVSDELSEIIGVTVDGTFAPFGFDPALVSFDENNVWVSLEGSMCHFGSMGSMPDCGNPLSPTGYDNEIVVIVTTVPEPGTGIVLPVAMAGLGFLSRRRRARHGGRSMRRLY